MGVTRQAAARPTWRSAHVLKNPAPHVSRRPPTPRPARRSRWTTGACRPPMSCSSGMERSLDAIHEPHGPAARLAQPGHDARGHLRRRELDRPFLRALPGREGRAERRIQPRPPRRRPPTTRCSALYPDSGDHVRRRPDDVARRRRSPYGPAGRGHRGPVRGGRHPRKHERTTGPTAIVTYTPALTPAEPGADAGGLRRSAQFRSGRTSNRSPCGAATVPPGRPRRRLTSQSYAAAFNEVQAPRRGRLTAPTARPGPDLHRQFWATGPARDAAGPLEPDRPGRRPGTAAQRWRKTHRAVRPLNMPWPTRASPPGMPSTRSTSGGRSRPSRSRPGRQPRHGPDPTWTPLLANARHSRATCPGTARSAGRGRPPWRASSGPTTWRSRPLRRPAGRDPVVYQFSAAAEEAGMSRIYGGIHYQFDNPAGLTCGRATASTWPATS